MSAIEPFQSRSRASSGRRAVDAVIYHALISKTFAYAYYHVPKCACTTLKNMLWRAELAGGARVLPEWDSLHVHGAVHDPRSPWLTQRGAIASELAREQEDRFWFVVVRNPYARILSAYQWLFIDGNDQTRAENYEKLGWNSPELPSFPTFVELVSLQHEWEMDHHWAPISSFVPLDDIAFDAVVHMEHFSRKMPEVMERIFGRREAFDAGLRMFKSSAPDWETSLKAIPTATLEAIEKIYARDFEAFGYSTDPSILEPLEQDFPDKQRSSKISENLRYHSEAWASQLISGPDSVTIADIVRRFLGVEMGEMRGLVLRNNELPKWWSQNGCQLWTVPGVPLPAIIPHPGVPLPTEALVVLAGEPNPGQIMLWGKWPTVVVCAGAQLRDASMSCGDESGIIIGPRVVSAGQARIDARNGGSIIVEGDGLWFHNVRLANDALHAIRDRASGARLNSRGADVRLGRRVWLGDDVVIEPGATIGEGSAIGHRARVVSGMPANSWCNGNPASVYRSNIHWGFENET